MLGPLARSAGQLRQEVLGVQDAEDVVAVAAVDGDPRVPGVDHLVEHLFPGERGGDGKHVGPRGHDLRNVGVAQLDHAFDHFPGFFFQQAFAMAFGDDGADVFFERFFVGDRQACGRPGGAGPRRRRAPAGQTARAGSSRPTAPARRRTGTDRPTAGRRSRAARDWRPAAQQQAGQQRRRPRRRRQNRAAGYAARARRRRRRPPRPGPGSAAIAWPGRPAPASAGCGPSDRACSTCGRSPPAPPARTRPARGH